MIDLKQFVPIVKIGENFIVRLSVGHQSWDIFTVQEKEDADWMQRQLINGLRKIVLFSLSNNEAAIKEKDGRIAELESALRLNLAVSPDDPLLITPAEKQIADLRTKLAAAEKVLRDLLMCYGETVCSRCSWEGDCRCGDSPANRAKQSLKEADHETE